MTWEILEARWASYPEILTPKYFWLTKELYNLDLFTGVVMMGGIPHSLHWSRRFEYPWVMNSMEKYLEGGLEVGRPSLRILDVGAGMGPLQFWLAKWGDVLAIDINYKTVVWANEFWHKTSRASKYEMIKDDASDMTVETDCFDLATCVSALEHMGLEKALKALGHIHDRLVEDGLALITWDVSALENAKRKFNPIEHVELLTCLGYKYDDLPWPAGSHAIFSDHTEEGRLMSEEPLAVFCVALRRTE